MASPKLVVPLAAAVLGCLAGCSSPRDTAVASPTVTTPQASDPAPESRSTGQTASGEQDRETPTPSDAGPRDGPADGPPGSSVPDAPGSVEATSAPPEAAPPEAAPPEAAPSPGDHGGPSVGSSAPADGSSDPADPSVPADEGDRRTSSASEASPQGGSRQDPEPLSAPTASNRVQIGVAFHGLPPFDVGTTAPGSTIELVMTVDSALEAPVQVVGVEVTGSAFRITQDSCTGHTFPGACTVLIEVTPPDDEQHLGKFGVDYVDVASQRANSIDRALAVNSVPGS